MITGDQIRAARKRAGYSQEKLAELVGVSLRTVGSWERGNNTPGIAEQRLLEVLRDHLDAPSPAPLRSVSDVELLAEIARRFARSTLEQEAGDGDEQQRDPAPMRIAARRTGEPTDAERRALKTARQIAEDDHEDSGPLDGEDTA